MTKIDEDTLKISGEIIRLQNEEITRLNADLASAHAAGERKGRAMGMREAYDVCVKIKRGAPAWYWENEERKLFGKISRALSTAADELDPPTDKQGEAG